MVCEDLFGVAALKEGRGGLGAKEHGSLLMVQGSEVYYGVEVKAQPQALLQGLNPCSTAM